MNCGKLTCSQRSSCTEACDDFIAINPPTEEDLSAEKKELEEIKENPKDPEPDPADPEPKDPEPDPADPEPKEPEEIKDNPKKKKGKKKGKKAKKKKGKSAPGTGYCMKCRKSVKIKDASQTKTKSGTPMLKGKCPTCSTTVCRLGLKKNPVEDAKENPGKETREKIKAKVEEAGDKVKSQVKKAKALPATLKVHIVTFWVDNRQHVVVVKSKSKDAAKSLIDSTYGKGKELKQIASYTLDDWIEASWRKWGTRQSIAKGLSAETRKKNWDALKGKAKSIVRRNFLLTKINTWAAPNPPEDWDDVEDEVAGMDEVEEGYDPSLDEVRENPQPRMPPARFRVPPGYLIERENPPPDDLASCKHCGGNVLHSGKLARNPKGGKVFWLLGCEDCGAKYKLVDN